MSDDDVSRTAILRSTTEGTNDGLQRRSVLGGVAAAAGVALGFSGAVAADETASPDDVSPRIPTCDDDCTLQRYCCEEGSSGCLEYCWYCYC